MQNLAALTEKYIDRSLTKKEREQLKKLILENKANLSFFKEKLVAGSHYQIFHDFDADSAFDAFETMCDAQKSKSFMFKKWLPYAASFVGAIILVAIVFHYRPIAYTNTVASDSKQEIKSTGNADNVVLTLADGTQKIVHSNKSAIIAQKDGKPIVQTTNSGLDYSPAHDIEVYGHHKVYVPNGQKFNLTLSDGTKVWMNSGSTLTFPPRFDGTSGNRIVYLNGEAYFDVVENKDFPFIVNINDLNIKVLGTEFNVAAYEGHPQVATTLVEGSVHLYDGNSNRTIILEPNQQAEFDKFNKSMTKKEVDVGYYTAWMQNKIVFRNMPMNQILESIERTYNVHITNENVLIANERFNGEFDVEDIQTVFKTISTAINFEYEIIQNHIIIKK